MKPPSILKMFGGRGWADPITIGPTGQAGIIAEKTVDTIKKCGQVGVKTGMAHDPMAALYMFR